MNKKNFINPVAGTTREFKTETIETAINNILNDEMDQIMAPPPAPWRHGGYRLGVKLQCWSPDQAFIEFMRAGIEFGVPA